MRYYQYFVTIPDSYRNQSILLVLRKMGLPFNRKRYKEVLWKGGVFTARDRHDPNQFLFYVAGEDLLESLTVRVSESRNEEIRQYLEWLDQMVRVRCGQRLVDKPLRDELSGGHNSIQHWTNKFQRDFEDFLE
ncbi:hypothetical protein SAMN04487866_11559 [Thermoactinomyces sp. DSM 45891]|uniref:hypothetical protein n=1 Tax=Thermoactinomyces sp. DSM 45891 TaxID=1761907 RepID=UPI00091656EC|nr:hypothetical protein [Thermoactinomyces sp. DSM 45891]SFX65321.1 hypothetical protein SAMN04487866_11559 [Thermoactinomyces sp. DSM 45891]